MTAAAAVKTCVVDLVMGRTRDPNRALGRVAARALREARGGRDAARHEIDDLLQDFLVKVLDLREKKGAQKLATEWNAMPDPRFAAYVRSMMKNLAHDGTPTWDLHRTLRQMVKTVLEAPLPAPAGMPSALDKGGRFSRKLVAAACAELLVQGGARDVGALTRQLSAEYGLGHQQGASEVSIADSEVQSALEQLEQAVAAEELVATFVVEAGEEARKVLALRNQGFKEMAARLDLALSTAHARFAQAAQVFRSAVHQTRASNSAIATALEQLTG